MIVCFKCSRQTKECLDEILTTGQYSDQAEAISCAIENLLVLQEGVARTGSLVLDGDPARTGARGQPEGNAPGRLRGAQSGAVPEMFLAEGLGPSPSWLPRPPRAERREGCTIPLDQWLFGQFNKLLPVKANCRALAHLLKDRHGGVPVKQTAALIAEEAMVLARHLRREDERFGHKRDVALATAFPAPPDKASKGRRRYADQFVGSVNKHGHISGLLTSLRFAIPGDGPNACMTLTKEGWEFALLPSPVLDEPADAGGQKFSEDERSFVLAHIAACVPEEDFAFKAIINAIWKEADTPDKIDAELRTLVDSERLRSLSRGYLSSQRSGAISRMVDLGLIVRVKDAARVNYVLTEIAAQYLERAKSIQGAEK